MCFLRNVERTLNFFSFLIVHSETRIGRPQAVKVRITSNSAHFVKTVKTKCVEAEHLENNCMKLSSCVFTHHPNFCPIIMLSFTETPLRWKEAEIKMNGF